ncbi:MAG: hypothetical protein KA715_14225 [Xanthomonadaceae bacterium]|nr:hypothetical protein [Xanthomonadaceae bacterium]
MKKKPILGWFPLLYFYQALPFFWVTSLSTVFYKQMGVSNTTAALLSSIFYAPWILKAFGGPWVQSRSTLKRWIVGTQTSIALLMMISSIVVTTPFSVTGLSILFMLIATLGTLHDIAAEGEYIHALTSTQHASMIGVRATFFRLGWLAMQGGAITLIGITGSWQKVILVYLVIMGIVPLILSRTLNSDSAAKHLSVAKEEEKFLKILAQYFKKNEIIDILLFLLLYRFSESQLQKLAIPFFIDPRVKGGLEIPTTSIGVIYGTLGPLFLTLGGLLSGWLISRYGLTRLIVTIGIAANIPHALYTWMAFHQPEKIIWVATLINIEQFFYGVGFTAYLLFMVKTAQGKNATAHYAISAGFMAMGMMIPGSWSGWLADRLGYSWFFVWVLVSVIPSVWVTIRGRNVLQRLEKEPSHHT